TRTKRDWSSDVCSSDLINSAKDLASLKLTELRTIAAQKGLRGVSGLRKGDLITAIVTGQVPGKTATSAKKEPAKAAAAAPQAAKKDDAAAEASPAADNANAEDKPKSGARRPRRVVRSTSSARAEESAQDDQGHSASKDNAESAAASSANDSASKAD